jgi:uncharacterized protein (DUF4415 family)
MKHKVTYIENDDELNDDIEPEYDFAELHRRAREEGREYRGILSRRNLVRLDPDIMDFFQTSEAVNEALRRVMREQGGTQE